MVKRHFSLQTVSTPTRRLRNFELCYCASLTQNGSSCCASTERSIPSCRVFIPPVLRGTRESECIFWKKRNTVRSRFTDVTAISTESVAFQIQNLHKRDKVRDSPYLSKNETQNNEIYVIHFRFPPIFFSSASSNDAVNCQDYIASINE